MRTRTGWLSACGLLLLSAPARADDLRITLDKGFIEAHRDRATITENCFIDKALKNVHAQADDGDLHVAARCDMSRLPAVIEIKNARLEKPAVKHMQNVAGDGQRHKVHGVWRLWAEHANNTPQAQGSGIDAPLKTTNPAHVYEIHPALTIDDFELADSVKRISGFDGKPAESSISAYERTRCALKDLGDKIEIRTTMVGFNHPVLRVQLWEKPRRNTEGDGVANNDDGWHAFAEIQNKEGELLARKRRLVLVDGTAAGQTLAEANRGDNFTVMAMPRMNLSLISWRIEYAACTRVDGDGDIVHSDAPQCHRFHSFDFDPNEILNWDLPYELVVVAVLRQNASVDPTEEDDL